MLALLAPWNFYLGGHFHLAPGWSGQGWMHSPAAGGDYHLWISFTPITPGYLKSPLKGTAFLCTPKGERFRLNFSGSMPRNHGKDLRGVPIHLYMGKWSIASRFSGDLRPHLDFYGTFGNSQMTLEDRGSLARAFRSDATLSGPQDRNRPWKQPSTSVTLQEDSSWAFNPGCPATPR